MTRVGLERSPESCESDTLPLYSIKYEPISIKIARIVPKETLNKTLPKMPTSPKVCACTTLGNLKCQIELLTQ